MTISHDECVPDNVITNIDHVITDDVIMDHVITLSTSPTIHIILSVDQEHFQGKLCSRGQHWWSCVIY